MATINFKLYTICFLDSLCIGLILPILSNHIFALGGTHTLLGILSTGYATFQLISGPLVRTWRDTFGKRFVLIAALLINLATYLPLGLTTSNFVIVLLRLIFAATNQIQTLCKSFVPDFNPQETHSGIYNVMNALTVAGLVIGPIVSGQMYEYENGFIYVTMLASLMLSICLLVCFILPSPEAVENTDSEMGFVQKIKEDVGTSMKNLEEISLPEQWDVLLLKYFYHTSITVFFIKFSLLLKVHYQTSSTVIGYTYAYQSILTFLSHFIVSGMQQKFPSNDTTNLVSSLFIVTIGFLGLCYAPTYDFYLISFIPMILAHTLINKEWKDLFNRRSTEHHQIEGVDETIAKVVSIITPVIFGICCDMYGHYALGTFVIVPLLLDILIAIVCASDKGPVLVQKED